MLKKTRVETHMQRETQTDKNCLKQTGRRVFLYISICEGGVWIRRHRWEDDKNTGAYIQPKPVKSRGINSDAGTPRDDPMLFFSYPV